MTEGAATARIEVLPLTKVAFAPFGEVIEVAGAEHFAINQGTTERFHDLAEVDVGGEGGRPLISIFCGQPRTEPIRLTVMERHPLGSQAFFPLQDQAWLVVVADGDDPLSPAAIRAFRATGNQGVNYRRNVWHHPLLVRAPDSQFLIVDRGGPGDNLEERYFSPDQRVELAI